MSRMRLTLGFVTGGSSFRRLLVFVGLDGPVVRMDDTFTPQAAALVHDAAVFGIGASSSAGWARPDHPDAIRRSSVGSTRGSS